MDGSENRRRGAGVHLLHSRTLLPPQVWSCLFSVCGYGKRLLQHGTPAD